MSGLRRGYKRSESSGYYRELFIKKYIKTRPKRDFLGIVHWVHDDDEPQPEKPPREPLGAGVTVLIILLVVIACFALAILCALPLRLLSW